MRIKKLMVKGFGALRDWEAELHPFWTEIPLGGEEREETVNEVIMALLFGFPPAQRWKKERFTPKQGKDNYRAAMIVETADGQFLLGRHFAQETLEIFKLDDQSLHSLSPMFLMDLLFKEIGIINPLDFSVLAFFQKENLLLDQNAPLVREHIQKLRLHEGISECLIQTTPAKEDRRNQLVEEVAAIDQLLARLDYAQAEVERLRAEEAKYRDYEKFLSPAGEDLLALTAREYTAVALEKSFYEEKLREELETREILERAVAALRQKIAAYDPLFYTDEKEKRVVYLLKRRAELNERLEKEEEALAQLERRGSWLRIGNKEKEEEIKKRMSLLLDALSRLREELKFLLKDKKPEEFLAEKKRLAEYRSDLARLERPPLFQGKNGDPQIELARLRQREAELRRERERLLALAGDEDLETVQAKVKKLTEWKTRRQEAEEALASFLKKVGGQTPEATRRTLLEKREECAARLRAEENVALTVKEKASPLFDLYVTAGRFLSALTEGRYQQLIPQVEEDVLKFLVKSAQGGPVVAAETVFPQQPWADLAFRLALAKEVWETGKGRPLLLLDDFFSGLPSRAAEELRALLTEEFADGQIILRVQKGYN
ncbi:MAG TPA: hypothetical protein VIL83_01975 [Capillibacterium sp.]